MTKVAAILIVKGTDDEAPHLERVLKNITPHVDRVFLNLNHKPGKKISDKVLAVVEGVSFITTEWHDDFAEARNANLAQVPDEYEWVLWLDTDDIIDHPEKIKEVIEESKAYDAIYVDYLYEKDEEGNPLTVHMVARMFKNNGTHQWKGSIHETLVETRGILQGATKDFMVIHQSDEKRRAQSFERNINMLEMQLTKEAKDPDPRTFYYLGCTYMDAGHIDAAKVMLEDYLTLSGWDQERSAAHTKLGRMYFEEGNRAEAKKHFMQAIGEDPDDPEPRVEMGSLELDMKQYHKATRWLEEVTTMEKNMTTLERNPMSYTFRTYLLLADAHLNIGGKHLKDAAKYAKKARKFKKKNPEVVEYTKMIEQVYADKTELEGIIRQFKDFKDNGKLKKAKALLDKIPQHLADNVVVAALKKEFETNKWPPKSIAIMTGDTAIDEWGSWSLDEGIGGSEEAIIRMSRHFIDLGYKVVVFGKVGANTGLDQYGVMWRNYWDCNLDDEFDIFVGWRAPFIFEKDIKARKKYLWLHDVMEPGEFTPKRIANFTKCIVVSKYHRSLFPMIPDEKILLSGNGIDPKEFTELDGEFKRDPHKVFYGSSHVRGLAYLYEIWPEVKKAVPDATLDVYYGRGSYDAVHKGNPERMKWMDDMEAKAKELDGVIDHGKVSHKEINKAIFSSGVWAYPCPFPEVYCITAVKAQAGGAVPVSSNFAALDETVQYGVKLPMAELKEGAGVGEGNEVFLDDFKDELIAMLKDTDRQEKIRPEMMKWARTVSWENVAKQWNEDFKS